MQLVVEQEIEVPNFRESDLQNMNEGVASERDLHRRLDNLALSADAKAVLSKLMKCVVRVGQAVISIGRAVLTFALDLIKLSPTMIFGTVVATAVSALIASVPILGALLGPLLSPILLAFGLGMGALSDGLSGGLRDRLDVFIERYRPIVAG